MQILHSILALSIFYYCFLKSFLHIYTCTAAHPTSISQGDMMRIRWSPAVGHRDIRQCQSSSKPHPHRVRFLISLFMNMVGKFFEKSNIWNWNSWINSLCMILFPYGLLAGSGELHGGALASQSREAANIRPALSRSSSYLCCSNRPSPAASWSHRNETTPPPLVEGEGSSPAVLSLLVQLVCSS